MSRIVFVAFIAVVTLRGQHGIISRSHFDMDGLVLLHAQMMFACVHVLTFA